MRLGSRNLFHSIVSLSADCGVLYIDWHPTPSQPAVYLPHLHDVENLANKTPDF